MFGISKKTSGPTELVVTLPSGKKVTVTWKKVARSRSARIRVGGAGVIVTTPTHAPQRFVENFLQQQSAWLETHISKTKPAQINELWYRGKPYQIEINNHGDHTRRVTLADETCTITPVTPTVASTTKVLERWLISEAGTLATPWIQTLAKAMGVEVPQLRFRQTTSRWGSCTQHGAIMLNWRLIHAPDEVFRYVVIHELAHRVHMNHSKDFWDLVRKFDPSYPIHTGWLKRNAGKCVTPEISLE